MKLKLGLIGLSGDWEQRHRPALRLLQERFDVNGVYCPVSSLSRAAAREFDARQFDGFREMLRCDDIDAVLMLQNGWYGIVPILAACDYGKAVYCGSEIAIDPNQAARLKEVVDRSGIAFMAEFPRRFAPATLRLKELIVTRLGRPELIFCHRRLPSHHCGKGTSKSTNGTSASCDPSQILDRELVELIDWCSFIAGAPVRKVQGIAHQGSSAATDYHALSLDLSPVSEGDGTTVAQISCGSYIPATWHEAINFRPPAALQVCCENGLAFLDLPNGLIWFDEAGRHHESLDSELTVGQQLLTQFHRAVTSLVRKMGDLEDVCRGLHTLQRAKDSVSTGSCMTL